MKRSALLIIIALTLCLVIIPTSAIGASWQSQESWTVSTVTPTYTNLTLTAGGGSWWSSLGAYNFSRSHMTSAGFQPLDNVSAFSIAAWVKPAIITGAHGIVSQLKTGPDYNNRVELYQNDNDLLFRLGTGSAYISLQFDNCFEVNNVYLVGMTWGKSLNAGKFTGYCYCVNSTVFTNATSATGFTGMSVADGDLYLGGRSTEATFRYQGKILSVMIFTEKLAYADFLRGANRSSFDYVFATGVGNYWLMNHTSGTTVYDLVSTWKHQEPLGASVTGAVVYEPVWRFQDQWNITIWNQTQAYDFSEVVHAVGSLVGMILIVIGPTLAIYRTKDDWTKFPENLILGALCVIMGFALMVGYFL